MIKFIFVTVTINLCVALFAMGEVAQILTYENNPNIGDGKYSYKFTTSNDIAQQEDGLGGVYAAGSAQWFPPDSTQGISFSYTADENGYHPVGDHLPTPPPIPELIQKALAYIAAHPPKPEVRRK